MKHIVSGKSPDIPLHYDCAFTWTVPSSPAVSYSLHILTTNKKGLVKAGQGNGRNYLGKSACGNPGPHLDLKSNILEIQPTSKPSITVTIMV